MFGRQKLEIEFVNN